MFPLQTKKLILDAKGHIKQGRGIAADYVANQNILYAPFDGIIETYYGVQGGKWLALNRPNGDRIEHAHLDHYLKTSGDVKMGEAIAVTGNTGQITTGPHLHIQILRKGVRLDPEKYEWNETNKSMTRTELDYLYALLGIDDGDESGRKYWLGKPLIEFLKVRTADVAARLQALK